MLLLEGRISRGHNTAMEGKFIRRRIREETALASTAESTLLMPIMSEVVLYVPSPVAF